MSSHFARSTWRGVCALTLLALAGGSSFAQVACIPRQHNAWGKFNPGSWTRVRQVTEEFDESGNVKSSSTTTTKTTLIGVDNISATLRLEVTVEVAGKHLTAQPRIAVVGYMGQGNGETAIVKPMGTRVLKVGGKSIACNILQATINHAGEKRVRTIYYSSSQSPYVLKRETKSTDLDGRTLRYHSLVEAIAIDMPYKVLADVRTVAYLRTVKTHPKGSTHTVEVFCMDVPGGVVAHTSKDLDEKGHLVRRSTLELLDYGETARQGLFGHGGLFYYGNG